VASAYGVALVQQIEAKYPLSPRVREAFLMIPRHAFLTPREDVEREQWLNEVYQDTAVVTKLDRRGMPLSSSSQPSVMAWMLEALEIQPGRNMPALDDHRASLSNMAQPGKTGIRRPHAGDNVRGSRDTSRTERAVCDLEDLPLDSISDQRKMSPDVRTDRNKRHVAHRQLESDIVLSLQAVEKTNEWLGLQKIDGPTGRRAANY